MFGENLAHACLKSSSGRSGRGIRTSPISAREVRSITCSARGRARRDPGHRRMSNNAATGSSFSCRTGWSGTDSRHGRILLTGNLHMFILTPIRPFRSRALSISSTAGFSRMSPRPSGHPSQRTPELCHTLRRETEGGSVVVDQCRAGGFIPEHPESTNRVEIIAVAHRHVGPAHSVDLSARSSASAVPSGRFRPVGMGWRA